MNIIIEFDSNNNSLLNKILNSEMYNEENSFGKFSEHKTEQITTQSFINKIESHPALKYLPTFKSYNRNGTNIPNVINIYFIDDINIKNNEVIPLELFSHFNSNTGKIFITESLFTQSFLGLDLGDIVQENESPNTLLHLAISHEIGHLIQHQKYLSDFYYLTNLKDKNINDLLNPIIKYKSYFKDNTISTKLINTIKEGFAECFSCLCINTTYSKKEANKIISTLIKARQSDDSDFYNTINSISKLHNLLQNKSSFDNLETNITTIEKIILSEATFVINDKLNLTNNIKQINDQNVFFGSLKSIFINEFKNRSKNPFKNCLNCSDVINALNKQFNLNLPANNIIENNQVFNESAKFTSDKIFNYIKSQDTERNALFNKTTILDKINTIRITNTIYNKSNLFVI